MSLILIISALFGLVIAFYYYIKISRIPITQGIENTDQVEKLTSVMEHLREGMNILQRGNIETHHTIERLLEEVINLRTDIDGLKAKVDAGN